MEKFAIQRLSEFTMRLIKETLKVSMSSWIKILKKVSELDLRLNWFT